MSPEQALGQHLTVRSDLFSLGVVLYEMSAGRAPFQGQTSAAVFNAILHEKPPSVTGWDPILDRLLAKDPAARYATAAELRGDLEALRRGEERVSAPDVPAATTSSGKPGSRRVVAGATLALIAAGMIYVSTRPPAVAPEVLGALESAAAAGKADEAFATLSAAGLKLDHGGLRGIAAKVGGMLQLETAAPGATVTATRIDSRAALAKIPPATLGTTPLRATTLVAGEYLLSLTSPTAGPLELLARVEPGKQTVIKAELPPAGQQYAGMVVVEDGGKKFLIDRTEVTNAQFLKFVASGGYRDPKFWAAGLSSRYVDRTGVPGPRSWSGGTYPTGKGDYPVVGVSWFEAAAYARWAGHELPTAAQWWLAALGRDGRPLPWGSDGNTTDERANFSMSGTSPAGAMPSGLSPFGCYDMAGNVREWVQDSTEGGRHVVLGGSYQDPTYMFDRSHVEGFDASFASDWIGIRTVASYPDR
jgi:hypothetical protein